MSQNSPHLAITLVEAINGGGAYTIMVSFDSPKGPLQVPMSLDSMLSYAQFQREALEKTGLVFTFHACDGRPPVTQDETWNFLMRNCLSQSIPKIDPTATMN